MLKVENRKHDPVNPSTACLFAKLDASSLERELEDSNWINLHLSTTSQDLLLNLLLCKRKAWPSTAFLWFQEGMRQSNGNLLQTWVELLVSDYPLKFEVVVVDDDE